MPVAVSYPGVYVQELSSGVHSITGVATSIAAFIDVFSTGPIDQAVQLLSYADFERAFGGLAANSEASYAIQQFFQNGGSQAYAIRITSATTANAATAAAIGLADKVGAAPVLVATAKYKGASGAMIQLGVDYATAPPGSGFNLTVTQFALSNGSPAAVAQEVFRGLVVDPTNPMDAAAVVNDGSNLITLAEPNGSGKLPAPTGTTSKVLPNVAAAALAIGDTLSVALNGGTAVPAATLDAVPATLTALAAKLQTLIRGAKAAAAGSSAILPGATVTLAGSSAGPAMLVVAAGTGVAGDTITLTGAVATKIDFTVNVSKYALGAAASEAQVLPGAAVLPGGDGTVDFVSDAAGLAAGIIGDANLKTGMNALMDVDLFNILCIPATMSLTDSSAAAVAGAAVTLCTTRRAMYILDAPQADEARDSVPSIQQWLDAYASLRSRNAALYFPRLETPDPLAGYRARKVAPSGTVAGVWARTDGARGVWKAPAGTEATLSGVQKLGYKLTDPENGVLNPLAINCLRVFPVYGPVCWGARTLNGADQMTDEYKYIPVRRLALFIEESLFRGTQWVVFEPNDTPLWAQIRLNVGAFMQTLFLQGAFQGSTPQDAYFVRCDATNNPPASVNLGIVNINVGFAPLKPAEFVVLQIQQIAAQAAA